MEKIFFSFKRVAGLLVLAGCCTGSVKSFAQTVSDQLQQAFQHFESDSQLKHAVSSLYVIEAGNGEVVFDKNSQTGLSPASTQKIITSVTAFELLGKSFRFTTKLAYDGEISKGVLNGNLYIVGSADPTFGSWRWESTGEQKILRDFAGAIKKLNVSKITGSSYILVKNFEEPAIPDGWIWQDIGNYYGAGASFLNWRENQYDVILRSGGVIGTHVEIVETRPRLYQNTFRSEVTAAPKGTGDNAYIYLPIGGNELVIKGTIPVGEKQFRISGAIPSPVNEFYVALMDSLGKRNISIRNTVQNFSAAENIRYYMPEGLTTIHTNYSPPLDSIIYWFNKRSINLYGEALIKTLAYEQNGFGRTDSGVAIVKKFWKNKGIEEDALNIYDGSGLSPLNRVTTHAQVEILKYAKSRDWYPYFYDALPEYNAMKMKSGTINDVKGFCGYHKAKDGKEYIFSFLVNNYTGKSAELVAKMYKVLDVLK